MRRGTEDTTANLAVDVSLLWGSHTATTWLQTVAPLLKTQHLSLLLVTHTHTPHPQGQKPRRADQRHRLRHQDTCGPFSSFCAWAH